MKFCSRYQGIAREYTMDLVRYSMEHYPKQVNHTLDILTELARTGSLETSTKDQILSLAKQQWQLSDSVEFFLDDVLIPVLEEMLQSVPDGRPEGTDTKSVSFEKIFCTFYSEWRGNGKLLGSGSIGIADLHGLARLGSQTQGARLQRPAFPLAVQRIWDKFGQVF